MDVAVGGEALSRVADSIGPFALRRALAVVKDEYDLIVVDGPAAGHAITFLTAAAGLADAIDPLAEEVAELAAVVEQDAVAQPIEAVGEDDLALGAGRHTVHLDDRADLVAHDLHRLGGRPDEHQARLLDGPGKGAVLREEPVPGMDGPGARLAGGLEDAVAEEVKEERWHRFMQTQALISRNRLRRKVGSAQIVLVDSVESDGATARSMAACLPVGGMGSGDASRCPIKATFSLPGSKLFLHILPWPNAAGMADLDAQIAGFCAELGIEAPL